MPYQLAPKQVRLSSTATSAGPNPEDPAWREWQGHVDAGRIGSRPRLSFENRLTHIRNEIALFGRVVTPELERF
jgi:hypothetical protein